MGKLWTRNNTQQEFSVCVRYINSSGIIHTNRVNSFLKILGKVTNMKQSQHGKREHTQYADTKTSNTWNCTFWQSLEENFGLNKFNERRKNTYFPNGAHLGCCWERKEEKIWAHLWHLGVKFWNSFGLYWCSLLFRMLLDIIFFHLQIPWLKRG